MQVANSNIAAQFYISYAVFQIVYANSQSVQFFGKFFSKFLNFFSFFTAYPIFTGQGSRHHLCRFVTCNISVTLKMLSVHALYDSGVSQFRHGLIRPTVLRHIRKRIGCRNYSCHHHTAGYGQNYFIIHKFYALSDFFGVAQRLLRT